MKWVKDVLECIEQIKLSKNNNKFKSIIETPWGFEKSNPCVYNISATNDGETNWQRKLYENETCWYDLELPIGQKYREKQLSSLRVDLIGMKDDRPVICELKYTKDPKLPFDAILQLLSYYRMIVNNAEKLDVQNIHHSNARNCNFRWMDIANNPILMLKANKEYWGNWTKLTQKNIAAKTIINICKKYGIEIQLYSDDKLIL